MEEVEGNPTERRLQVSSNYIRKMAVGARILGGFSGREVDVNAEPCRVSNRVHCAIVAFRSAKGPGSARTFRGAKGDN